MQKIRKKYQMVKALGPELTYVRTHVRTHESEFIGSFRSLKTSGEPTSGPMELKLGQNMSIGCKTPLGVKKNF